MKNKLTLIFATLSILIPVSVFVAYEQNWIPNIVSRSDIQAEKVVLIEGIQKKAELIDNEKNYQTKILDNEQFLPQMTDGGGQLIGYFKDGKLYKITERLGLSYGVMTYEYYFSDTQLMLVNEKEEDFLADDNTGTLDYEKVELAFEGHYYFDQEKLVEAQTAGTKRFSEGNQTDVEVSFLKTAKENVDLLTK